MKKLSLVIAALAMVLGITQCKKQEDPVGGKLITQKVTFTTSFGNGSKLGVDEEGGGLDLSWQVGDKITVSDGQTEPSSTLECKSVSNNGLTGTFEGTITCIEGAQLTFAVGTEPKYKSQHFTSITKSEIYLKGTSEFKQDGDYNVDMTLPYAILKVDLAELAPESGSTNVSVKIGGIDGNEVAKVTDVSAEVHQFYLLLPLTATGQTVLTFTNTTSNKTITHTYTLAPNGFYTGGGNGGMALILPDGVLPGVFTVADPTPTNPNSGDETKVRFSQGNLYYDGTNWGFEEEQYYFRTYCDGTHNGGKCDAHGYNQSTGTANGHWGLFGWSTTKTTFGMSTSGSSSDYWGSFYDWGKTIDDKDTWRTLSGVENGEWHYLFDNHVNVWGTCNSVPGRFIAPDGFAGNQDALLEAIKDWESAQAAGIVFLPAAGRRDGVEFHNVGAKGDYWSSSSVNEEMGYGYFVDFGSNDVSPYRTNARGNAFSVRLVTNVE